MTARQELHEYLPVEPLRERVAQAIERAGSQQNLAREFSAFVGLDPKHVSRNINRILYHRTRVRLHTADEWCIFLGTSIYSLYPELS